MTDLTYNIETGILSGRIGGHPIRASAGSGGRAGSKVAGAVNPLLANNALATRIGGPGSRVFGPLPQGIYRLRLHEHKQNWIRLIPAAGTEMFDRNGFAIHGRGQVGSHGCIVPWDFQVMLRLCKLLKENEAAHRPDVTLKVFAQGTEIGKQLYTA
ncbi:hypothetical protein [Caballeronia ptereochthonis]|uniref:DUF2778 domain-containing protein n=1 Tax=Caballeronia ptereochthonis TaxID=1777144 RepID=A0A157ZZ89_9BURK|nr:hypothetical protein [Caballeronia ptereochthonis]SAK50813.1 hypothetical protein AWB83_01176 [Caballeronia ptereochthonis]